MRSHRRLQSTQGRQRPQATIHAAVILTGGVSGRDGAEPGVGEATIVWRSRGADGGTDDVEEVRTVDVYSLSEDPISTGAYVFIGRDGFGDWWVIAQFC